MEEHSPVQGHGVAGHDVKGVRHIEVAEHVAPHVHAVDVLDGGVGIAPRGRPVEGGDADAVEGALVLAVDEDALGQ